ncbi:MAG: hypothetical protein PHX61_12700 [Alphaproteobacteria bacterium]|nr:hypothetical protein [Alphaproteobacteria bacterium]
MSLDVQVGGAVFDQVGLEGKFVSSDPKADNSGNPAAHACQAAAAQWGANLEIENFKQGLPSAFAAATTRIEGMARVSPSSPDLTNRYQPQIG